MGYEFHPSCTACRHQFCRCAWRLQFAHINYSGSSQNPNVSRLPTRIVCTGVHFTYRSAYPLKISQVCLRQRKFVYVNEDWKQNLNVQTKGKRKKKRKIYSYNESNRAYELLLSAVVAMMPRCNVISSLPSLIQGALYRDTSVITLGNFHGELCLRSSLLPPS